MAESKKKKIKYDAEYISYIKNGESAAVFITRDLALGIPTSGMWVDVVFAAKKERKDDRWDFNYFIVELFPRKIKPVYPKNASADDKKYITWQTAHKDIDEQRKQGYHGKIYKICPRLVNRNKGKVITKKAAWNITFDRWVPDEWFGSSCEWRKKKIPVKARWEYELKTQDVILLSSVPQKIIKKIH